MRGRVLAGEVADPRGVRASTGRCGPRPSRRGAEARDLADVGGSAASSRSIAARTKSASFDVAERKSKSGAAGPGHRASGAGGRRGRAPGAKTIRANCRVRRSASRHACGMVEAGLRLLEQQQEPEDLRVLCPGRAPVAHLRIHRSSSRAPAPSTAPPRPPRAGPARGCVAARSCSASLSAGHLPTFVACVLASGSQLLLGRRAKRRAYQRRSSSRCPWRAVAASPAREGVCEPPDRPPRLGRLLRSPGPASRRAASSRPCARRRPDRLSRRTTQPSLLQRIWHTGICAPRRPGRSGSARAGDSAARRARARAGRPRQGGLDRARGRRRGGGRHASRKECAGADGGSAGVARRLARAAERRQHEQRGGGPDAAISAGDGRPLFGR